MTNASVPQQEVQSDATEDEVIADYDPDVDYEGSEPDNKPVDQKNNEENSKAEYAKMEIPHTGTFCQRMMFCELMIGIQWLHREQGPEIMASWLQDMYIWL